MASEQNQDLNCNYLDRKEALKGEIERQLIHLSTGVALIVLIWIAGDRALYLLLLLLASYVVISVVILTNKLPDSLSIYLCKWGRPSRQNIPFKGTLLLLSGVTISLILFPQDIVYASVAVVAFGDSIATAAGVLIGRHKLPYSEKKTIEGTVSGILAAFLASSFFVTPAQALIGSAGGMLLESIIDLQTTREFNTHAVLKLFLNDNFLIPVFSGLLMSILG